MLYCSVVSSSLQPHGLWPPQALLPIWFPRQEYRSRLPFPSPGNTNSTDYLFFHLKVYIMTVGWESREYEKEQQRVKNEQLGNAERDRTNELEVPERGLRTFWNSWRHCFVVQSLRHAPLFSTSWTAACQASLSFITSWHLPIEWMMPSSHLGLCYPLLFLPSIFPSIRVFSNESALHIRRKYQSFSFSISPMLHSLGSSQLWVMKKRSNYIHFMKLWEMCH